MTPNLKQTREGVAVQTIATIFGVIPQRITFDDTDYRLTDKQLVVHGYLEVVPVFKRIYDAYPLPISVKKLSRLFEKRLNPIILWSLDDGIIYAPATTIRGEILVHQKELMAYFDKTKEFKYIKYRPN